MEVSDYLATGGRLWLGEGGHRDGKISFVIGTRCDGLTTTKSNREGRIRRGGYPDFRG